MYFFGKPTFVFNSSDFRPKFDEFSTNCQFDENFRRIFDKLSFRQNVTFDQSLHSTKWFSTKCHGSVLITMQDAMAPSPSCHDGEMTDWNVKNVIYPLGNKEFKTQMSCLMMLSL